MNLSNVSWPAVLAAGMVGTALISGIAGLVLENTHAQTLGVVFAISAVAFAMLALRDIR